ncbi:MAG: aspartate--tRNA ligase [Myxococcota bacterium]
MSDLLERRARTHMCGALRAEHVDQTVVLKGWVKSHRDKGGVVFMDLRDREGYAQVVVEHSDDPAILRKAAELRPEWVVGVVGRVRSRGDQRNTELATGEVEVVAEEIEVFNKAKTPPFEVKDDVDTFEDKRLTHRYLDLRRPVLQRNLMLRSRLTQLARESLDAQGFVELETPFMVKYTPGGARNFLVPSRLNPGSFYALAESPQLFKQLFMIAGYDRYFQVTRCFRDEDFRQDRQPEFTQIDVELSFGREAEVKTVMERVVRHMFAGALQVELPDPFPQMRYEEAMARFGSDKPDVRFGLEHVDVSGQVRAHEGGGHPLFQKTMAEGGMVKLLVVPADHKLSRKDVDGLEKEAKNLGATGLGRARIGAEGGWTQSPFAKSLNPACQRAISKAARAAEGDLLLMQFGPARKVHVVLHQLRMLLGRKLDLIPEDRFAPLWVTEFPLFEEDEDTGQFVAAHHPFTSPRSEDVDRLATDPGACRARAYDLVLNGFEVAGGSVRIHDPEVQSKVFDALSMGPEEQREKFGFLLDALAYGAPPHAGIAAGLDRLAMIATGAGSLRDVIPFPKTSRGLDLMSGAPTPVSEKQLNDLALKGS